MSNKIALLALVAALSFGVNAAIAGVIMPSKPADHSPPSEKVTQGCVVDPNFRTLIDPNFKNARRCGPIEGFLKALLTIGDGSAAPPPDTSGHAAAVPPDPSRLTVGGR